jgi:hypothetical protein
MKNFVGTGSSRRLQIPSFVRSESVWLARDSL